MLDGSVSKEVLVWGIPVPVNEAGRRSWPDEIKALAVERIASGCRIVDVAREIGANKSLVAKWLHAGEAEPEAAVPGFVELIVPQACHGARTAAPTGTSELRIRLGDAEVSVPPGYPSAHLAEVLRAVRAAQ